MKRFVLAIAILLTCVRHCLADDHRAVVKIVGGCTAVCVSESGLIMTAKHCTGSKQQTVAVQFGDRRVSARRVYVSSELDGPVVFDCEGGGYPFASVGTQAPQVGEQVYCVGYPGGDTENRVVMRGKITGGAIVGPGLRVNMVDFQTMHGMSGCPLFNSRGEVIGLLHGGNASSSVWITFAATRAAYDAVKGLEGTATSKPTLYVFTFPDGQCPACDVFKADVRAGHFDRYRVEYVTWRNGGWDRPEVAEAVRAKTKSTLAQAPTFWPAGSEEVRSGYERQSRNHFLEWLDGVFRALVGVPQALIGVPPRPTPSPDPIATPSPQLGASQGSPPSAIPEPAAAAEFDWSDVTFVGLASTETPKFLRFLKGPAKRAIAELSGGKAVLNIVAERTQPARFEATVDASGANPDPLYLLVLVEKQHLGLKGLVVKLIEEKVRPLLGERETLPIDVIFRRAHPDDYAAIEVALETQEIEHFERSEERGPASAESTDVVDAEKIRQIVQAIVAPLARKVDRHEKLQDFVDRLEKKAKDKDAPISWLWGLLAAPLAAFRRHYLDAGASA